MRLVFGEIVQCPSPTTKQSHSLKHRKNVAYFNSALNKKTFNFEHECLQCVRKMFVYHSISFNTDISDHNTATEEVQLSRFIS